jgi:hypothetical protein
MRFIGRRSSERDRCNQCSLAGSVKNLAQMAYFVGFPPLRYKHEQSSVSYCTDVGVVWEG